MKKVAYILTILLTCLLLTVGMLFLLVRSSKIQTAAVAVLTDQLSRGLQTEVRIGTVDYKFPTKISIDGVYVEDLQHDTLLWVDTLRADFDIFGLLSNRIAFSNVLLQNGYVNLYEQDTVGTLNLQFLLDLLPETMGAMTQTVEVKNVQLDDVRFRFNEWYIQDLTTHLSLNHFSSDSIDAQVDRLSLREHRGFRLNDLQTRIVLTSEKAEIRNLLVELPHSRLLLNGLVAHTEDLLQGFQQPQQLQLLKSIDDPTTPAEMFAHLFDFEHISESFMALHIEQGDVTLSDLGSLVPQVKNLNGLISVSGDMKGLVRQLSLTNLSLAYKHNTLLKGDVRVAGLPRIDTAYIKAEVQDLMLNRGLVQDFLSDMRNRPFMLPAALSNLGEMHYKGQLEGRLDSLELNGALATRVGQIQTRGHLIAIEMTEATDSTPSIPETMAFRGIISTPRFALGRLIGQPDLGNLSMRLQVDGITGRHTPFKAMVNSDITQFQYRKYTYRNIHLQGNYADKEFDGEITVNDENVQMHFKGLADLTQELPILNFDVQLPYVNFGALNLSEQLDQTVLSGRISLNGSGNSLDNVNGYLYVDSLFLKRGSRELNMDKLRIYAETGENEPTNFKIQSDYLNANFTGNYKYSQLPLAIARVVNKYMPQMLSLRVRQKLARTEPQNDINFYVYLKNLNELTEVFDLPLTFKQIPTIKGFLNERTEQFALKVAVPGITLSGQQFDDITLNFDNEQEQINLGVYAFMHAMQNTAGDHVGDLEAFVKMVAKNDSIQLGVDFNNLNAETVTAGALRTTTRFTQYAGFPLIDMHIKPSDLILTDTIWNIGDSHIIYSIADTSLQVNHFSFGNQHQFIYADGLASKRVSDSIRVQLQGINLDYILAYTKVRGQLSFGGYLTGWATAYSLFSNPMFEAEVKMDSTTFNGTYIGDAHGVAYLNKEEKTIDILADVVEGGDTVATMTGIVYPMDQAWELNINADSTNLGFINFWTEGILDDLAGRAFGWVKVWGKEKHTYLMGKALAKDAAIGVDMIGARLYFTDSVTLGVDYVDFSNIHAHDAEGNNLLINGRLSHNGMFEDLTYKIDAEFDNVHVMNLPAAAQQMFYGQVYASGELHIAGDEKECRISANARTMPKTHFYLNVATASNASDNSFITFVDHHTAADIKHEEETTVSKQKTRVLLDLQLEGTRDAEVSIIIDPRTGDELSGRGEGNIRLTYDVNANDIKLYGAYTLETGKLYFTLENLIRKEFTIRQGSQVIFAGDPLKQLQIDASAQYSTTASLRDLFGTDYAQLGTNRSSVPVNCIIYLRDNLMNPLISFGIEMPQADESVANQVHSVINTDEMMLREIMYLLVFNRFYTPEYLQSSVSTGVNEMSSLLSSTVTGQINNWLRKLTNNFTIGFNFRTDSNEGKSSQEYEAQFQYQPNSRLLINGNFGYRYNDISNQPVFGNLDVEYILSPSGHWRAKAYTHMVDKYSLREAHTVQGVGLMFKYDFNKGDTKRLIEQRKQQRAQKKAKKSAK